jgi:tetratricopeptide (TPR) repeat protein
MLAYNLNTTTMKKYIYTIAIAVLLSLGACNKQLDIKPTGTIDQTLAIRTSKDVQSTLVGTYNRMGNADLYGGGVFYEPDLLATQEIIDWNGTFQNLTEMVNQRMVNSNSSAEDTWLAAYVAINQTNNVLANLKLATNDDEKSRWEGEAKFLRGLVYFDLVRLYGKSWKDGDPATNLGVPIVLTPTTTADETAKVARATVKQGYDQAIKDLTEAKALLPEDNSFYANKYAAQAILARLYLQQGEYEKARDEANDVIKSGVYGLNDKYEDEFPSKSKTHFDNTIEDIFAIQVTQQLGTNAMNTYYASSGNAGRGDIRIKDEFLAEFEPGDVRGEFYTITSVNRTQKFNNQYGNVHVIRLAELYLIRAEANSRLGEAEGDTPVNDINALKKRAHLASVGAVTLDDILMERRHELAFEGGFFLHDAKRLQATPDDDDVFKKYAAGTLPYNSPKLIFPIPLREILANPKLHQNETY